MTAQIGERGCTLWEIELGCIASEVGNINSFDREALIKLTQILMRNTLSIRKAKDVGAVAIDASNLHAPDIGEHD